MSATIAEALKLAAQKIDRFEAQYLLADLLAISRASLIAHPERVLDARELSIYERQVAARAKGTPVAYILGKREFYGREFLVNEQVLIPRPETETLIEQALKKLSALSVDASAPLSALDLGTGSGIIAITLKLEFPSCNMSAVDSSRRALEVAQQNSGRLNADVHFVESDWFSHLRGEHYHLIAANPPYVAKGDPHLQQGDLRFEPQTALTDNAEGAAGLACIRRIVEDAPAYLYAGGWLLCEHGWDQAEACKNLLFERGFAEVSSENDLAGIPRVVIGRWPG